MHQKENAFNKLESTDFGNEVGADEINWWITRRESDVDELLARTKAVLKAAQSLKGASEKLKDGEPDSYEKLLLLMKGFVDDHKVEVNTLAEYVAWLEKRDPMAPRILFTYRVWGSTLFAKR